MHSRQWFVWHSLLHSNRLVKTNLWLKGHHLLDFHNRMPSYVTNRKEETTNKISLLFTLIAQWSRQKIIIYKESLSFLCNIRSCVSIECKSSLKIILMTTCLSFFLNSKSFSCSIIDTKYNNFRAITFKPSKCNWDYTVQCDSRNINTSK